MTEEITKIIEQTVYATLRQTGQIPSLISRTEMIKIVGSAATVDRAIADGDLRAIRGDGRNAKKWFDRSEFDRWLARLNESPIFITNQ